MKFASMLTRLRNTQGGMGSTSSSSYNTPYPYSPETPTDPCAPLPGETDPPWITEAKKYIGWDEDEDRTVKLISDFATRLVGSSIDPSHDRTGWCAAFAGGILLDSRLTAQHSLTATDYQNWGEPCRKVHGAIAVFGPGTVPGGHVGFIVETTPGNFELLGGNQSDTICEGNLDWYMRNKTFLGYRWPSECSCPSEASESSETDGQSSE